LSHARALHRFALCLALSSGCSFTTATGFEECKSDLDCAASSVCSVHYCLPMWPGCQRVEGAFDAGARIAIGAVMGLTGADGGQNDREVYRLDAMRLAISEANKLGLAGVPYALYACNAPNTDVVPGQTSWLISNLRVPAIIVSGSDRLLAAEGEPTRLDAGTFMISPNATTAGLIASFQEHGNVWRVAPPDTLQAQVLLGLFDGGLGPDAGVSSKIVVVAEDTAYGNGFRLALVDALASHGYTSVKQLTYTQNFPSSSAYNPQGIASALNNEVPAATILVGFPADVVQVIAAASSLPRLQYASGHRWFFSDSAKDPSILTTATRGTLEGAHGTAPAQGKGAAYQTFTDTFSQRFGVDPNGYSFLAHSSDAMWLTLASTAWAGQSGGAITGPGMRSGIANMLGPGTSTPLLGAKWNDISLAMLHSKVINVDGSSGDLQFDLDAGAPASPYEVWAIVDGGITTLSYVTP